MCAGHGVRWPTSSKVQGGSKSRSWQGRSSASQPSRCRASPRRSWAKGRCRGSGTFQRHFSKVLRNGFGGRSRGGSAGVLRGFSLAGSRCAGVLRGFSGGSAGVLRGGFCGGSQGVLRGFSGGSQGGVELRGLKHVPKAERAKRPNASQPRRRSHTHFAALHTHGFAAERRPHACRIPTAIRWQTRRVTNRPSEDPGPCRRCTAALSSSADAPTCITLGSHAKSGPRLRRLPQTAVPCGRRIRASLSPTHAPEPTAWRRGSVHPDHRLRGWNRVASPRRVGRIPAGFRRPSIGNTKRHESSIR
jgi:hypothetical protein